MSGKRTPYVISGRERAAYGALLTFENDDGKVMTFHRTGPTIPGARSACDAALSLDPTFRLVAYSTPQTIYTDLVGGRADFEVDHSEIAKGATYKKSAPVGLPEAIILGRIGRSDLLHPRLVRYTAKDTYRA